MGRWVCSVKVLTTLDASSMRGTFISSAGVGERECGNFQSRPQQEAAAPQGAGREWHSSLPNDACALRSCGWHDSQGMGGSDHSALEKVSAEGDS